MTDPSVAPKRPFYELLGIQQVSAQDGLSVVDLDEKASLGNSRGDVHGGAIYSLLDAACADAARSALPPSVGAATIGLTVSYMTTGRGKLTAHGRVLRAGKSVVFVEADARDQQGTLVAKAHGTMRAVTRR